MASSNGRKALLELGLSFSACRHDACAGASFVALRMPNDDRLAVDLEAISVHAVRYVLC